jgi:hypothetical protein
MMEDRLVEYIAKNLVDDPEQVMVRRKETGSSVIIHLHVGSGDMGRVIGKSGRVANAIRALLRAGATHDKRVILEID